MKFSYNNEFQRNARNLRKNQTDAERLLWSKLRNRQLNNCKFYRQYPIGSYVIDFYCPEKKLSVEVDGGQHLLLQNKTSDTEKQKYLLRFGIKTLRFWDNDVLKRTEDVLSSIFEKIK